MSILKIEPAFDYESINQESFSYYFESVKKLIKKTIPKDIWDSEEESKAIFLFIQSLPIVKYYNLTNKKGAFSFVVIGDATNANGIKRFMADVLCKWLIPGKQLTLPGSRSMNFRFSSCKKHVFFISEYYVNVLDEKDIPKIKKNIEFFINQLKLNLLSVHDARSIMSIRSLSFDEKSKLIQKNILSLLKLDKNEKTSPQLQNFIFKISSEKNLPHIKNTLDKLIVKRINIDKDIALVHESHKLFKDHFIAVRESLYTSKIISYFYLFKKLVQQNTNQNQRATNLKIVKTKFLNKKNGIGVLLSLNFLVETERFEKKHLIEAIKAIFPDISYIKKSLIEETVENKLKIIYIEVSKKENSIFSQDDIIKLQKQLKSEIIDRIENVINPIFMPQSEKVISRNIFHLSNQLKYVDDIPQIIITYDKQRSQEILFTVILVRILKEKKSIKDLFLESKTILNYIQKKTIIVDQLKNKYQKEANIFTISINKSYFYRKNFSLNLQKARYFVAEELKKVIGNFRDYNGAMMGQQKNALDIFKASLPNFAKNKDLFLENFFYSIKPVIMQSILDTSILKKFFFLFLQTMEQNLTEDNFLIKTLSTPKYLITTIALKNKSLQDFILNKIEKLDIPSFDLTSCYLEKDDIYYLGYILKSSNVSMHLSLYYNIMEEINAFRKQKLKKQFTD